MAKENDLDLLSPFESADIDSLFFAFAVMAKVDNIENEYTHNISYTEDEDRADYDVVYYVFPFNPIVCKKAFDRDTFFGKSYEYINIANNERIRNIIDIHYRGSGHYINSKLPDTTGNDFVLFNFREYAKTCLGIDLPEGKININKAKNILKKVIQANKNKSLIELPSDKMKAARVLKENFGYNTGTIYDDIDVLRRVEKIDELASKYAEVFSSFIQNRINLVIDKYFKALKEEAPKFKLSSKDEPISLEINKKNPKQQLLSDLDEIYFSVSNEIELIKYLDELIKSKDIIEGDETEHEESALINVANSIKNNSQYLPNGEEQLKIAIELLEREITQTQSKLNSQMRNDDSKEIELEDSKEISTFKQDFKMLDENIKGEAKFYKPYIKLKESLDSEDTDFKGLDTLDNFILSMNYVVSQIPNTTQNTEIQETWEELKQKYSHLILNIISDDQTIAEKSFKDLEMQLRTEMTPLLQQISFSNAKHINQIINTGSILYQIEKSIDLVYFDKEVDYSKEPITSAVKDIKDLLKSNAIFDHQIINVDGEAFTIEGYTKHLLEEKYEKLKSIKVNNYDEYDAIRHDVLKSLMGILLDMQAFEKSRKEFEEKNDINR